jgi:hypothetical protein
MSYYTQYRRKQIAELRPWVRGDCMANISVSEADRKAGSPKPGDMISRNPKNHDDQWLVAAQYFADTFEPISVSGPAHWPQEIAGAETLVRHLRIGICDGPNRCRSMDARAGCLCAEAADTIDRLTATLGAAPK